MPEISISFALFFYKKMAERVGFEPTVEFPLHSISNAAPSSTRPSLRAGYFLIYHSFRINQTIFHHDLKLNHGCYKNNAPRKPQ